MDEATKARLKAEVVAARRYWAPFHEGLLERDPAFLEAYLGFLHGPWRRGALAPKVREFIYVAADLSCAHLYATGAKRHMQFAMEAGATPDELLEVIELAATLGSWTARRGLAILGEELARRNAAPPPDAAGLAALRARHEALLGGWPDDLDAIFALAPDYVAAAVEFMTCPRRTGPLDRRTVEFVCLALCASPATLFEPGMRWHIRRALAEGATHEELGEVLQLAGAIAIHSCSIGVPALMELERTAGG